MLSTLNDCQRAPKECGFATGGKMSCWEVMSFAQSEIVDILSHSFSNPCGERVRNCSKPLRRGARTRSATAKAYPGGSQHAGGGKLTSLFRNSVPSRLENMEPPHQLTREALEEFKAIYAEEFAEDISNDEAQEMALRLLGFFDILLHP